MRFEFATATRIIFGPGTLAEVGPAARTFGQLAFVVVGTAGERVMPLLATLMQQRVAVTIFKIAGEPDIEQVQRALEQVRIEKPDMVIGFGGGSAVDAGKAVAILATNGGEPLDYLEVIGRGKTLTQPALPYIAVPTTAGTGAEVTRNAVLVSPGHRVKASLRSPLMLPRLAVVDPVVTHTMPPDTTASTGLDALTQLIEPFVSTRATPISDAFCREGIQRVARSLRRAYAHGDDASAREDMSLASLLGGLALANAGLGAVHGIASVVGGMFAAPHGAVCARLLPHVMAANVRALQERQPEGPALARYDEIARLLTGRSDAKSEDGIRWVCELCRDVQIPPLAAYGMSGRHVRSVVEKSLLASSTKANPIALTEEEMKAVVYDAIRAR